MRQARHKKEKLETITNDEANDNDLDVECVGGWREQRELGWHRRGSPAMHGGGGGRGGINVTDDRQLEEEFH